MGYLTRQRKDEGKGRNRSILSQNRVGLCMVLAMAAFCNGLIRNSNGRSIIMTHVQYGWLKTWIRLRKNMLYARPGVQCHFAEILVELLFPRVLAYSRLGNCQATGCKGGSRGGQSGHAPMQLCHGLWPPQAKGHTFLVLIFPISVIILLRK